ncbi:branched-chain amino acid transport system permease protein [Kaistia soli DSM 19436]|uniref:Branched-chain amino acid transport system permease protein n=1 Tax=Kaistia soli DSM 19436 TaxID=1122133 RepID=A0A1M5KHY9_9HYPH|nr:branched-chain amino acid ABC transporter permease [Kaistia soli]SHG52387.1 branched-chain amino acid transport system permease protein [Kaistia soli DSM 19436]
MAAVTTMLSRSPGRHHLLLMPAVLLVLALCAVAAPFVVGEGLLRLSSEILLIFAMAQMWNLLSGYAGLLSIGHQVFVGAGAYGMFALSIHAGVNPYVAIAFAPFVSGLLAALVAPILFRLRDAYFTIGMWVFSEIVTILVGKSNWLGGQNGLTLSALRDMDPDWISPISFWWAAFAAIGSLVLLAGLMRSRLGLALLAVRDNDVAASSLGIDVWRSRFIAFVISAAGTGLCGAIYFLGPAHILPAAGFDPNWVVIMLFICVVGGLGTIEGPIVGTIVYFGLRQAFATSGNWYLILMGSVAVVVMLVARKGLWGTLHARYGISLIPIRREPPSDKTFGI